MHATAQSYFSALEAATILPEGFLVNTLTLPFAPAEKPGLAEMRLTLVFIEKPTSAFAAVYTRNEFPGAPVQLGRERLAEPSIQCVLINTKVSNVGVATGRSDAETVLAELALSLGVSPRQIVPASTGVIGWRLPVDAMVAAVPALTAGLHRGSAAEAARAIMTTDAYPKALRVPLGEGSLVGFCKGAGMIEPNMGTMLAYVFTDVDVDRDDLRTMLRGSVEESFNCISVDSDQSTSDSVLAASSRRKPAVDRKTFADALRQVLGDLAADVVRNGEGVGHVISVEVFEASDFEEARSVGKAVVNSPLVKTAIFGNDPNVGRILCAVGDYAGNAGLGLDPGKVRIAMGGRDIFADGGFRLDLSVESELAAYLRHAAQDPAVKGYPQHDRLVRIEVHLGRGGGRARVLGSDLSYDYVRENADYRS